MRSPALGTAPREASDLDMGPEFGASNLKVWKNLNLGQQNEGGQSGLGCSVVGERGNQFSEDWAM